MVVNAKAPPGKGAICSLQEHCSGHNDSCCPDSDAAKKYGGIIYGKCNRKELVGDTYWCPADLGSGSNGQRSGFDAQAGCGDNATSGANKCASRWSCWGKCAKNLLEKAQVVVLINIVLVIMIPVVWKM